jgi:hypothetical protein
VVRGFSFQKVPNCDGHGPRSHINRVGPVKTTDQVPAEIVQIGIDDGGNLRPLFVVAKNLAVANYSDNLAGLRIDDIALEHVFSVLRVRCDVYNSEFGGSVPPAIVRGCREMARSPSDVLSPTPSIVCEPCNRHGRYTASRGPYPFSGFLVLNSLPGAASVTCVARLYAGLGGYRRDKTEEGHQLSRRIEPAHVADLGGHFHTPTKARCATSAS